MQLSTMANTAPRVGVGLVSPLMARAVFLLVLASAAVLAFAAPAAVPHDADLVRLLRFMAAVKAVLALGAAGAVVWRLGVGVTLPWFAAYALAGAAMAAGPGVIWGMAHVGLGAVLLHGGLAGTVLLLWRDQAAAGRLAAILAARR
jgi:hypothetical protein